MKSSFGASQAQRLKLRDSIRGKKDIAWGRLSSPNTKSVVDSYPGTSPFQLASILNNGPELLSGAPFKFTTNTEAEVGQQSEGRGVRDAGDHKVEISSEGPIIEGEKSAEVVGGSTTHHDPDSMQYGPSHGDLSLHQVDSCIQVNCDAQSTRSSLGGKEGTVSQSWVRPIEGVNGDDRMEAEDGSGATPSC